MMTMSTLLTFATVGDLAVFASSRTVPASYVLTCLYRRQADNNRDGTSNNWPIP